MSINLYTKAFETKLYFIVFILFSSFLTLLIYHASLDTAISADENVSKATTLFQQHLQAVRTATSSRADISGWKTYRNDKYGFEVKWPWKISEKPSEILFLGEDGSPYISLATSQELLQTYCDEKGCRQKSIQAGILTIPIKFSADAEAIGEVSMPDGTYLRFHSYYYLSPESASLFNYFLSTFKFIK